MYLYLFFIIINIAMTNKNFEIKSIKEKKLFVTFL